MGRKRQIVRSVASDFGACEQDRRHNGVRRLLANNAARIRQLAEVSLVAYVAILLFPSAVAAHSPHDVVTRLAVQHLQVGAPVLYAVVRGVAVQTTDLGRTWARLSAGIWRRRLEDIAVSGDGTLAVTDGHRIATRESEATPWEWLDAWNDDGPHVAIAGSSTGLFALSDGALFDIARSGPVLAEQVVVLTTDGLYATSDGTVAHVDGRTFDSTIEAPEALCAAGSQVFASRDRNIFAGSTPIHTADAAITSLYANGSSLIATLERDTCIVSIDSGATWQSTYGLTTDPQADEPSFLKPHFSTSTGYDHDGQHGYVIGGFDGFFFSEDGISWRESHGVLPRRLVSEISSAGDSATITTYGAGLTTLTGDREVPTLSPPSKRLFSGTHQSGDVRVVTHASGVIRATEIGASWKSVPIGAATSLGARHRMTSLAKQAALEIGGRIGTDALDKLRSVYKRSQSDKPQHAKLPTFGSVLLPPETDGQDWLLVAKPSGVMRSTDNASSFVPWLELPPGETLGAVRVSNSVVVLTPSSIYVSIDSKQWVERDRTGGGALDSIARWGDQVAVGAEAGLFTANAVENDTWTQVSERAVAAVTTGLDNSLIVQFDDGDVVRFLPDGRTLTMAAAGSPIMRHCVSFPDMAPLIFETPARVVGSDQYSIFVLEGDAVREIDRCTMLHPDRHELSLEGTWRLTPDRKAIGGLRATTQGDAAISVWVSGPSVTIYASPSSASPPRRAILDGEDVPLELRSPQQFEIKTPSEVGERHLAISVPDGFAFEGLELRHPTTPKLAAP